MAWHGMGPVLRDAEGRSLARHGEEHSGPNLMLPVGAVINTLVLCCPLRCLACRARQWFCASSESDEPVGQIGLWTRVTGTGRASTGYWVASQYRRRGYARAALASLSQWALDLDEVKRLDLFVEPWNQGSWRAAEAGVS